MIEALCTHRVDILAAVSTATDRLGRPVLTHEPRHEDVPARLEQMTTEEGETVSGRWRLYLPPAYELRDSDVVVDGDDRYTVDGRPARQSIPGFGAVDHTTAVLLLDEPGAPS